VLWVLPRLSVSLEMSLDNSEAHYSVYTASSKGAPYDNNTGKEEKKKVYTICQTRRTLNKAMLK
jgi:hypothetical protein